MIRVPTALSSAALAVAIAAGAPAGTLTEDLQEALARNQGEPVGVLVYMVDQADLGMIDAQMVAINASRKTRHTEVVRTLQDTAAATQVDLAAHLADLAARGVVTDLQPLWIINGFSLTAPAEHVERIAARDDVFVVYPDYEIELIEPIDYEPIRKVDDVGNAAAGAPEPGIVAVRAPEVWAQGITGEGILVASLDTGVEGTHPALADRWQGLDPAYAGNPEWAWFDPVTSTTFPAAFGGHGTHTMGSVCGGAPGDQVGVAPGARWIHAAVIDRVDIPTTVSDAILAFQWLTDPDGNPGTIFDVPHVCSNSWGLVTGHGYPECDETFWTFIDASEAAGTLQLFAAGNESSSGLRRPADRAADEYRSVAVAAVNANIPSWPIASFSSRGPTFCTPDGSVAIKPDIAAPGDDVRSAWPGGGYTLLGGTSMATPHVNGVVALMLQACPDLTSEDIKQIIYDTAFDLGDPAEDTTYGWGMIDAFEAVQTAFALCGPNPPRAREASYQTAVLTPLAITLVATDYDESPGGPLTYRITSLPASDNTLTDVGDGHVIKQGDLPYDLVNNGNIVEYGPGPGFFGDDSFQFSADDGGNPPDAGEGDPATISMLVLFDPPVITTSALPNGFLDVSYGPVQLEAVQGQPALDWSVIEDEYAEEDLGASDFADVGAPRNWHADDDSWNYSLPFAFPYYGQLYNSVWVCSNGFLDFASSSAPWTNSDQELINNVRIAPLWDDLRTNCSVPSDPGTEGDIYIDEGTPGQVTIRWDSVRYQSGCSTQEVNVSVTLHGDGRIVFNYGPFTSGLTPTIGVSAGDGRYLLTSYNNAGLLTNANSLQIFPPSPLPDGLGLSSSGELTGVPTETGSFEPRIRVIDSLGRSDQTQFTFDVTVGHPADVNGDGTIGTEDLLLLLAQWGPCAGCPEDVNGDGFVSIEDLLELLANWS